MVIYCQDLSFDRDLSRDRCARVCAVLGDAVVRRLVAFALYLLGATRSSIGRSLGMAGESVKTLVKTLHRDGLGALEDRRRSHSTFLPPVKTKGVGCAVKHDNSAVTIDLGARALMHLPRRNSVQVRTVLLTLYDAGLVKAKAVADVLDLSQEHVRNLTRRLRREDVQGLCDGRRGQQHDYRIDAEVKAELIQQYAAHAVSGRPVSSGCITEELNKRKCWNVSARSVRYHISKLGLQSIGKSLPEMVAGLKKTPDDCGGRSTKPAEAGKRG